MNRPLFRRREIFYILALVLASLLCALWLGSGQAAEAAVVERDGVEIDRVSLDAGETRRYGGVSVRFGPDGVWVEKADCPDKTCERTGKITRAGEAVVCLPNRVAIRLEGGTGYDAVTY